MNILYITEKPSQVEALRDALKKNNMHNGVDIIPLAGHIMQSYSFEEYDKSFNDSWANLVIDKKVPFFPNGLKKRIKPNGWFISNGKKITSDYKKKFADVKEKIAKADTIILATDPDNEGATLGLEVIEECEALNKVKGMINMSKLDIHSLSQEVKIIDKLPYMQMYEAGDSRAYFDQTFGINASIIATVVLGNGNTLQVGGVKLPTIRMVVERDLVFEAFKEVNFWTIKAKATFNNQTFSIDIFLKDSDKFEKEADALHVKGIVENVLKGKVDSFAEQNKTEAPPKPYSLTDLQSEANKKYKFSAKKTLDISQVLYVDKKVQSYPRVDTNFYADGEYLFASDILKNLVKISKFKELINAVKNIDKPMKRKIFDDSKIDGAHTAIAPTLELNSSKYNGLSETDKNILDLVAERYIIQFLDDFKYLAISGDGLIKDNICFKFSESVTQEAGWKISTDFTPVKRTIPAIKQGDTVTIDSISIEKGTTKPKPRFTEATLLKAMEKVHRFFDDEKIKAELGESGIGTPATRAMILEQLKTANNKDMPYFEVDKKGTILSTQKARDLIKALPEYISSPILRANMEAKLKEILKGTYSKESYFNEVKTVVTEISNTILSLGTIPTQKTVSKEVVELEFLCPLCQSNLLEGEKFFKCSSSEKCNFIIFKDQSRTLGSTLDIEAVVQIIHYSSKENPYIEDPALHGVYFDPTNKYFLTPVWNKSASSSAAQNNDNASGEIIETEKTFKKGSRFVYKSFRGKDLTMTAAEKLFDGKSITLTRKTKEKKDYKIKCTLKSDGTLETELVK